MQPNPPEPPGVTPEPLAVLGELDALVTKLAGLDLSVLSGPELLGFTREWERIKRCGAAVDNATIAELERQHVAAEQRLPHTKALLLDLLRIDPTVARQRVEDALNFGPRRALTGEPLPPILPATARQLAEGGISVEHARVVSDLLEHLPDLDVQRSAVVEEHMLDTAAHVPPRTLRQHAVQVHARLASDDPEPRDREIRRRRHVTLTHRPDGTAQLTGELTPSAAAALNAVLGALSAPEPAEDGQRDDRTPAQRRHDALEAANLRLLRSGSLPDTGGAPATILVTINHRDLLTDLESARYATTSYGQLLPVQDLLHLASEANLIPAVLTDTGGLMSYGRERRLATPPMRRALAARDKGCVRPGCTVPPDWCEAHHVIEWQAGGETSIDNLTLVCPNDHQQLSRGARIQMINGVPHWTDPPWLDPTQTPRRNTTQHPPITFPEVPDG